MKQTFSFATQYNVGARGIEWFLTHYPHYRRNDLQNCRAVDLINSNTNETLELKTDTYTKSSNFFMEHISHHTNGQPKLGGVFCAYEEGATHFAYLFINLEKVYVMRTADAKARTEQLMHRYPKKEVANRGYVNRYVTIGYAIPVSEYSDLFINVR